MAKLSIAHVSDFHAGSPYFVPNLMDRAVVEINELRPDVVAVTGDLTNEGFKQEFQVAKGYLDRLECPHMLVMPGNHDSRNVGYVHFEQLFGPRAVVLHTGDISIVGVDSTEPDLDYGTIGRSRYDVARGAVLACPRAFASSCCTTTCCPIPGTGRERNMVYDAGDTLEVLQRCNVNLVLSGHKHVPHAWHFENMFVVNAGTVCSLRLRGDTRPCYNIVTDRRRHVRVERKYPFHGTETIIEFSPSTPSLPEVHLPPSGGSTRARRATRGGPDLARGAQARSL